MCRVIYLKSSHGISDAPPCTLKERKGSMLSRHADPQGQQLDLRWSSSVQYKSTRQSDLSPRPTDRRYGRSRHTTNCEDAGIHVALRPSLRCVLHVVATTHRSIL